MKISEKPTDKKRVIVVDDSRTQLEMLKYTLENEGFDVASFNNGPEALVALKKQVPDLIITDVIMPGMDGYELCRQIKSTPALSSVPVILLTFLSGPEDVIMALQCGASTFVTKPCDAVSLVTTIKYLFANRELGSRLTGDHEIEVLLHGRKFTLNPSNSQMLDFLISTYETAVEQGHKLSQSHTALQEVNDQLEQKIEERTRELTAAESIINTVREPLIALDQDLRVVTVSRSFYDVFKVNPEETVGQLIYDLGNKQWDIPKLRELLETILPQKTTFDNYEVEHNFATIGRRIMLLNARQIQRLLGKELVILLAIEDITERKEIETGLEKAHEELKELAAELKRTARVKSEFLANMSHELRTPLNSINGFSEVLYDETFGTLNEKQKQYVNNVLISGKHLLLLINQILDMAKVEAGKMTLTLSSLSLKSLLTEISMLVADMVSKKKIEMVLEIPEDLPNIEADELKVKEIIYNLLSNAVKFTPEGGKIVMQAKKADSEIEIVVWDTGIGIAPENMGKLFEGFFRVDTPYSRVTEGTGLGLPLSRKLVELHGGKLSIESEGLNKGTSVRFTLPIVSRKVVEMRKKALVADDNGNKLMLAGQNNGCIKRTNH
jgi:two-component system cell cycle sensor histidine kinase PleC